MVPSGLLGNDDLNIDLDNPAVKNISGLNWSESKDATQMEVYVHVYNVPEDDYATDLAIRAYVDDTTDAEAPYYTEVAISSVAKAAAWLYKNDTTLDETEKTELQTAYLTYDVFFHDGESVMETTGVFGKTIAKPEIEDKIGYTFDGWWNKNSTMQWDFETTTIGGTTTNLYAKWTPTTYTAKIIRANGSEEIVEFTIENREEKLAAIALTEDDEKYGYSWMMALPSELALNNDQVFIDKREAKFKTETKTYEVLEGAEVSCSNENVAVSVSGNQFFMNGSFDGTPFTITITLPEMYVALTSIRIENLWTNDGGNGTLAWIGESCDSNALWIGGASGFGGALDTVFVPVDCGNDRSIQICE